MGGEDGSFDQSSHSCLLVRDATLYFPAFSSSPCKNDRMALYPTSQTDMVGLRWTDKIVKRTDARTKTADERGTWRRSIAVERGKRRNGTKRNL